MKILFALAVLCLLIPVNTKGQTQIFAINAKCSNFTQIGDLLPVCSSCYSNASHPPTNAIDSQPGTAWSCWSGNEEWIEIQLSSLKKITSLDIYWGSPWSNCSVELRKDDEILQTVSLPEFRGKYFINVRFTGNNFANNFRIRTSEYGSAPTNLSDVKIFGYGSAINYDYNASGARTSRKIVVIAIKSASLDESIDNEKVEPIEDFIDKQKVVIYPNPTKGKLIVEINGLESTLDGELALYNLSGALVSISKPLQTSNLVDLTNCDNGLYILKLTVGQSTIDWKVVKN